MLIIDDHRFSPLDSAVIIVSRQLPQIRFEAAVLNPPVEIQDLRLIPVDNLAGADQPVV